MSQNHRSDEFVGFYTGIQSRLYAFIYSLVGAEDLALDVLQSTNVVLWGKSHEYEPGTNFKAWAFRVAYFEVLAMREKRGRERLMFDTEILDRLVDEAERFHSLGDDRKRALTQCLKELPEHGRKMLQQRYNEGLGVQAIARLLGRPARSVSVSLCRLRTSLLRCINATLAKKGQAS